MLFALSVQFAGGVQYIIQVPAGKFAVMMVFIVFGHIEVNGAFTFVSISVLHDFLYQFYLFNDVSAGMWFDARRKHVQCFHCLVVAVDVVLCHFHRFELLQTGFLCDFVFAVIRIMFQMAYVGDIAYVTHLVAYVGEVTEK